MVGDGELKREAVVPGLKLPASHGLLLVPHHQLHAQDVLVSGVCPPVPLMVRPVDVGTPVEGYHDVVVALWPVHLEAQGPTHLCSGEESLLLWPVQGDLEVPHHLAVQCALYD